MRPMGLVLATMPASYGEVSFPDLFLRLAASFLGTRLTSTTAPTFLRSAAVSL